LDTSKRSPLVSIQWEQRENEPDVDTSFLHCLILYQKTQSWDSVLKRVKSVQLHCVKLCDFYSRLLWFDLSYWIVHFQIVWFTKKWV